MASVTIQADLDMADVSRILNLPTPTDPDEPARLRDLQSAVEGLAWKDSVRCVPQGNLDLSNPGPTIDGETMSAGDRVLIRLQSTTSQNGLYTWNGSAVAMTRTLDASTAAELEGAVVTVEAGTDAGTVWRQTQVDFTLGTDPVLWTAFGTSAPSASETTPGIAELATQAETDTGTDDARIVTPLKLKTWSLRMRKHAADIGDGSATQYDVTHNFNTRDVQVQVRANADPWAYPIVQIGALSVNAVRITFNTAPTSNQYRVIILG